jgi:hypothetical protein
MFSEADSKQYLKLGLFIRKSVTKRYVLAASTIQNTPLSGQIKQESLHTNVNVCHPVIMSVGM